MNMIGDEIAEHSEETMLGVLGGMGPDATVNFFDKLVSETEAKKDQDHIKTIIYNDPKIPNRNKAILEDGKSPLPRLIKNAQKLESAGVDHIAMPCNTAHYYYENLKDSIQIELFNMIHITRKELSQMNVSRVGLLATSTVIKTGVYTDIFNESPIELEYPDNLEYLMEAIYAIKRGERTKAKKIVSQIVDQLSTLEVDAIIVGCSDLSALSLDIDLMTVDPTTVLAQKCIKEIQTER